MKPTPSYSYPSAENKGWPDSLAAMADAAFFALQQAGCGDEQADTLTRVAIDALKGKYGGRQIYLPRLEPLATFWQEWEVVWQSRLDTHGEIAERLHLTREQVVDIVKAWAELPDRERGLRGGAGRWKSVLRNMADTVAAAFEGVDLNPERSHHLTHALLQSITSTFRSSNFYLPKGDSLKRWWRDCEIYCQSGRVSIEELAEKYNLTNMRIYQIQQAQATLRRRDRQAQEAAERGAP